MFPDPLSPDGPFGLFADELLGRELPGLADDRRVEAVSFVSRRATEMPAPLKLGITVLVITVGLAQRTFGLEPTTRFLQATSLPLVGELARMVRSLGFAYVWETWPDTSATGDVRVPSIEGDR